MVQTTMFQESEGVMQGGIELEFGALGTSSTFTTS